MLKTFIDKGVIVDGEALSINAKDSHGKTALIQAFSRGNVRFEVVKLLLERGSHVNAKDKDDGQTALIKSCDLGNTELVRLLLNYSADTNVKDCNGDTALIKASSNGHLEIVKLLLNNGARKSFTALKKASSKGHFEIEKLLIEKGADKIKKNENLGQDLINAAFNGDLEVVKTLLKKSADANAKNKEGQTIG